MAVDPLLVLKLLLSVALATGIALSARARAPQEPMAPGDLRLLLGSALMLYGIGGVASLTHHSGLAATLYAAGIIVSTLAAWLSRAAGPGEPPGRDDSDDTPRHPPGSDPDPGPGFDWPTFEAEFRAWSARQRSGVR